jgi:hypothetical protein
MSETQKTPLDKNFYARADAHIALANGHFKADVSPGLVNNSLMFAASRFNAWITAAGFKTGEEMKKDRNEILDFFTNQYRLMLEENFDNYADNFEDFMNISKEMVDKK